MARFGAKMARVGDSRKALTDAPPVFKKHVAEFANYALVGLNAQKTRFKSRTADPRFGHF